MDLARNHLSVNTSVSDASQKRHNVATLPRSVANRDLRMRCVDCHALLPSRHQKGVTCDECGREYPVRDGLLIAQGELTGNNRVAAAFYTVGRSPALRGSLADSLDGA